MRELKQIERVANDAEFQASREFIQSLVRDGTLEACGLDEAETFKYVELYKDLRGNVWRLAVPDHAFRGYLKKVN